MKKEKKPGMTLAKWKEIGRICGYDGTRTASVWSEVADRLRKACPYGLWMRLANVVRANEFEATVESDSGIADELIGAQSYVDFLSTEGEDRVYAIEHFCYIAGIVSFGVNRYNYNFGELKDEDFLRDWLSAYVSYIEKEHANVAKMINDGQDMYENEDSGFSMNLTEAKTKMVKSFYIAKDILKAL